MAFTIIGRAFKRINFKKPSLKLLALVWLVSLLLSMASTYAAGLPIVALALGALFEVSLAMVLLRGFRGEETSVKQLFESFKDWPTVKRLLLGQGWRYLWITIWGLIPGAGVVFGAIKRYEYSMVPYILAQNPDVTPDEALKISSEKTNGYKMTMFLVELIVFGGFCVVFGILALLGFIPFVGAFFWFVLYVLCLVFIAVYPLFSGLVLAAFYEEIEHPTPKAPKAPKNQPLPPAGPQAPVTYQQQPPAGYPAYAPQQPVYQYQEPAAPFTPEPVVPTAPVFTPEPVAPTAPVFTPEPVAPTAPVFQAPPEAPAEPAAPEAPVVPEAPEAPAAPEAPEAPAAPIFAPPPAATGSLPCPACGMQIPSDSRFCPFCGAKIG